MKSDRGIGSYGLFLRKTALIVLLVTGTGISAAGIEGKTTNTLIWDTMSPFGDTADLQNRTSWKPVPTDLLMLELNPVAASSDPGYYGREYAFSGDAVVENERLTAVFNSKKGSVVIYSNTDSNSKKLEFVPLELKGRPAKITHCTILQNTGQDAALEVTFSGEGKNLPAVIAFDGTGIVDIKPGGNTKGISLISTIEYGIVPSFIGDDLIFSPGDYASMNTLCVPSENLFVGLLAGQNDMLVVTWPEGSQQMKLVPGDNQQGPHLFESIDFENDGRSLYLAVLSTPGIWHKEELKPSYLEKDVTIDWKRPFRAKWITQLSEGQVQTTYTFKESKGDIWRGVIGHYTYPVWFSSDNASYRLSKKIPPKGQSIIYFLERKDTPVSVLSPVDIMKVTLGRQMCDTILDLPGRKLRTHHRRGGDGVRRACTCGCTEAIQAVFDAGQEVQKKEYVEGAVGDMVYFVTQHMNRIDEYRDLAREMTEFLNQTRKSAAELKPYLDRMEAIVQEIPQEYRRQEELIMSLKYADELAQQTKALTQKKEPGNLPAYEDLSMKWRRMGGAQDDLVAQCHRITRKLFQEAGYGGTSSPEAVAIARQIRARCTKCLRNADGYEIWADY
ncbi:MAG: hypothetical protein A2168_00885 [Planctomycetes bacterium RBG_13_50_24]|nr:MAG: hypothetical protein A2168_00885 [Planctomycetes bacterium RBG_13_50_24]